MFPWKSQGDGLCLRASLTKSNGVQSIREMVKYRLQIDLYSHQQSSPLFLGCDVAHCDLIKSKSLLISSIYFSVQGRV